MRRYLLVILTCFIAGYGYAQNNISQEPDSVYAKTKARLLNDFKSTLDRLVLGDSISSIKKECNSFLKKIEEAKKVKEKAIEQLKKNEEESLVDSTEPYTREIVRDRNIKPKTNNKENLNESQGQKPIVSTPQQPIKKRKVNPSYLKESNNLVYALQMSEECPNVIEFLKYILSKYDSFSDYEDLLTPLETMYKQLQQVKSVNVDTLGKFIEGINAVNESKRFLSEGYQKEKKNKLLKKLSTVGLYTEKQKAELDSITSALQNYYLCTSNVLDLISEVEDVYKKALNCNDIAKSYASLEASLKDALEFKYRVENIRTVSYTSRFYDLICNKVVCKDKEGKYDFANFNMSLMDKIKQELIEVRKK